MENYGDVFLLITLFAAVVAVVIWFALVIWTYRDMRARSRDPLARLLAAVLVALLNLPGVLVYVLLRPRETLTETYEQVLEEEALLQEIEEKPTCPGCSQRVQPDWQACPHCHTRLKKACVECDYLLELPWNICPRCTASQVNYTSEGVIAMDSRHVSPAEPPPIEKKWAAAPAAQEEHVSKPVQFDRRAENRS